MLHPIGCGSESRNANQSNDVVGGRMTGAFLCRVAAGVCGLGATCGLNGRRFVCMGLCMATIGLLAGCRSPREFRDEADRVSYDVIQAKQQEALGRTEPFTIETPAQTLRRRLLMDQDLPISSPASLTSRDVEQIEVRITREMLSASTARIEDRQSSYLFDRNRSGVVTALPE